ncbi:MAG: mechanosensitive ion channel [Candidatus Omnitrophica bacterium]|nr:mechanosensitive ion channel [Candidatus Omnitrophota bacterium]
MFRKLQIFVTTGVVIFVGILCFVSSVAQAGADLTTKHVLIEESLVENRMQAYERITELVEQKLAVLKNTDISFEEIGREILKAKNEISQLRANKSIYLYNIENFKKEINLLEQNIWARKIISELKEQSEEKKAIESLGSQDQRLRMINEQIAQLTKKIELVDVQLNIYVDYLAVIEHKRWEQFKNALLTPHQYRLPQSDKTALGILAIVFVLFYFLRRKIADVMTRRSKVGKKSFVYFLNLLLVSGLFSFVLFVVASLMGFQFLAHYVIEKIILTIALLGVFFLGYRLLMTGVAIILFHGLDGESQKDVPLFATLKGCIWFLFICLAAFATLSLWGFDQGHYSTLKEIFQKAFFSFGNVHLSMKVLVQFLFLIWIFNVFSHVVNKFLDKNIYPRTQLDESAQYSISVAIKYLLILVAVMLGLRVLGFDLAALAVFAGTVGIGIGLGLQEIAKNFISGIIMLIERPVKVGDWVEIGDLPGRVQAIKARGTVIQTFDNISVVVPNSEFITKQVVNWSYSDKIIRFKLTVGVAYGSDVLLVKKSLLEVAAANPNTLKHPEPTVLFYDFGDNSLGFILYGWTDQPDKRFSILSELHFAVNKLFNERNIVIAYPQRDIHLKTSDVVFEVKGTKAV